MTTAQREALMGVVGTEWASLPHIDNAADAQTMAAYLKTVPGVTAYGVESDNSVWCTCADGQPLVFINNEPENDPVLQKSMAATSLAGNLSQRHAVPAQTMNPAPGPAAALSNARARATRVGSLPFLPSGTKAVMLSMFGPWDDTDGSDARWTHPGEPGLVPILQAAGGYDIYPSSQDANPLTTNVALLRTLVKGVSVLYTDSHGGFARARSSAKTLVGPFLNMTTDQIIPFKLAYGVPMNPKVLSSVDLSGENTDQALHNDLVVGPSGVPAVVRTMGRYFVTASTKEWQWHYGVTSQFISQYFTFAPNSIWYNGMCHGAQTPEFSSAAFRVGLAAYYAWNDTVWRADDERASRYLFDRMAGANLVNASSPPNRPFGSDVVMTAMANMNPPLTTSTDKNPPGGGPVTPAPKPFDSRLQIVVPPAGPIIAALAPCISSYAYVPAYEAGTSGDQLTLFGIFGDKTKAQSTSVTVGGADYTSKATWTPTSIQMVLSDTATGDVVVTYNGHKSNPVQITSWRLYITTSNTGGPQTTSEWNVHLRSMLNGLRGTPDGPAPTPPFLLGQVEVVCMKDSTLTLSISGSFNTTGMDGDPLTVTAKPQTLSAFPFFEDNPPPASSATAGGDIYPSSSGSPVFGLTFSGGAPNDAGQALDHRTGQTFPWPLPFAAGGGITAGYGAEYGFIDAGTWHPLGDPNSTIQWNGTPALNPPSMNGPQ